MSAATPLSACLARGVSSIPFKQVAARVSGRNILAVAITLAFLPLALLLVFPSSTPALYVASSLYGFFLAPIYPAVMSLSNEYQFVMTGLDTAGVSCLSASSFVHTLGALHNSTIASASALATPCPLVSLLFSTLVCCPVPPQFSPPPPHYLPSRPNARQRRRQLALVGSWFSSA